MLFVGHRLRNFLAWKLSILH